MSFSSNKIVFALIMTATTLAVADDDDLFSDVRTNAVFDSVTNTDNAAKTETTRPKAITNAKTLREVLMSVGFDASIEGNRAATTTKQLNPWTFSVLVTISDDEKTIGIRLGLSVIKDEKQLSTETLLQLMSASQKHAPSQFTYSAKRQRTELSTFMTGNRLTGQQIRDEINRLAILAKETSAIWAVADSRTGSDKPSPEVPKTPAAPSTPSVSGSPQSLSGTWSAIRSDTEAFAVAFKADGTFNLVYVNDGKQTKTSGKFSINSGSLSLAGSDGIRLVGKLTRVSDREFRFAPQKTAVLTFTKAR
ncbi:MAG TPA: hypothetical protein EYG03_06200 [Planctomycetes bacterium]|nr:hypothetical protein [Fuerstiella sp.]HIK91559.1 hypothetical protein [Planctomycetota bacterium]